MAVRLDAELVVVPFDFSVVITGDGVDALLSLACVVDIVALIVLFRD